MDRVERILIDYMENTTFNRLSNDVVHEVKRRILDSLGVAIAAFTSEPVKIARSLADLYEIPWGSRILGTASPAPPDFTTFVDGLMIRYHDFNDTYLSKEPLHPSDTLSVAFGLGDYLGSSGKDVITAVAIAYEVGVSLCDAGSLRRRGWDHVNYIAVASSLLASKLLGLDGEKARHALAISVVPHASMRQTRVGELSFWKGAAAANSSRNAVFAALLASRGFTGPFDSFEGSMAFIRQLLQGDFDLGALDRLAKLEKPRRVLDTYIKKFPVEYHAQSAVEAAQKLREEVGVEEIEEIHVETFQAAYDIIVKDPEKWDPKTRETADHSLPWIIAATLVYGDVWIDSYTPDKIRNPKVLELMRKMKIVVSPELDRMYPEAIPNRITIRTRGGGKRTEQVDYPRGHPRNPMTDEEVIDKFTRLTEQYLTEGQIKSVIDMVFNLEKLDNVGRLIESLII